MTKEIDRKGWLGLVVFVAVVAAISIATVAVVIVRVFSERQ